MTFHEFNFALNQRQSPGELAKLLAAELGEKSPLTGDATKEQALRFALDAAVELSRGHTRDLLTLIRGLNRLKFPLHWNDDTAAAVDGICDDLVHVSDELYCEARELADRMRGDL